MSDLDEDYRRLSDLDASRPSESVRRAVLDHARHMAELRTTQEPPTADERPTAQGQATDIRSRRPLALGKNTRWQPAAFGMLAAAALAGLLVIPRFLVPSSKPAGVAPAKVAVAEVAPAEALAPRPPSVVAPESGALTARAYQEKKAIDGAPRQEAGRIDQFSDRNASDAAAPRAAAPRAPMAPPGTDAPTAAMARQESTTQEKRSNPAPSNSLAKSRLAAGRDADGHTPLMLAVLSGNASQVDALLARGADPNAVDADGTTPLQAAVANSQAAIAAALRRAAARGARSTEPVPIPN